LTKVPWSAPALEKEWRAAHAGRFPWFAENKMSSRVPKEACRVRAAGFSNYLKSKQGKRKGARMGFPTWRTRKHGARFRYDTDRAKPRDTRTVRLPAIGDVRVREDMSWLTDRIDQGGARMLGATVREQAGRWWISFQIEVDRDDINKRHQAGHHRGTRVEHPGTVAIEDPLRQERLEGFIGRRVPAGIASGELDRHVGCLLDDVVRLSGGASLRQPRTPTRTRNRNEGRR
jgi:hypothetical protein